MHAAMTALHQGEISFEQFANDTRGVWLAIGRALLNRWKAPASVDADDLAQEMLLTCWQYVDAFDGRGHLDLWLKQTAIRAAKRHLHRHRQVPLATGDRQKSRHAVTGVDLERFAKPVQPIDVDAMIDGKAAPRTKKQVLVLEEMMREMNIDRAIEAVISDTAKRLIMGSKRRRYVRKIILTELDQMAGRIASA